MTLSTHVLDATTGRPAAGMAVLLEAGVPDGNPGGWRRLHLGTTDAGGRLMLGPAAPGVYRLTFASGDYFKDRGVPSFYPEVTVTFEMTSEQEHYHVPLLLSPFAYSTYRGS